MLYPQFIMFIILGSSVLESYKYRTRSQFHKEIYTRSEHILSSFQDILKHGDEREYSIQ